MIDSKLIKDERLKPLFDKGSIIAWQVFILLIDDKKKSKKFYRIIYSWVIISSRKEISDEVFLSDFKKVNKKNDTTYSIAKLSVYNNAETIVKVINGLFKGNSICYSLNLNKIHSSKIKFDVNLNQSDYKVRPIIFNETNSLISRNFYEKASLNSPYQNVPSFSLVINNLDKNSLLQDNNIYFENWNNALILILKHLEDETTLPFSKSGCIRFGNIEFINTQCSNPYYINSVSFDNIKKQVEINNRKITSSHEVKVIIKPNNFTKNKKLIINCFLTNGGQVILDECREIIHEENSQLKTVFSSNEQIGQISISIWKQENDQFEIWYKHSSTLLRYISTSMGVVGASGKVKSEWLDKIEKSNRKIANEIRKVEDVSKSSYSEMLVGNTGLDPWVESDRNFYTLIEKLNPKKSDSCFFPKGWDEEDKTHGAISFLKWFKNVSDKAQHVVIQDPFFDTLGLEFLSRTTNSATKFTVLTCTQVMSLDDENDIDTDISEPNRAKRIKSFIENYPSLFNTLNLKVIDLRSTGGGDRNILHDRYILMFEKDELSKGFNLSNSIQGATKNHPLLVTSIPYDVLIPVNSYLNKTINNADSNVDVELIHLFDSTDAKLKNEKPEIVANQLLFNKLESLNKTENPLKKETFEKLLIENSNGKNRVSRFWSTFGYFLARTNHCYDILQSFENNLNDDALRGLREYLEASIKEDYPIGFSDYKDFRINSFQFLFHQDFKDSLDDCIQIGDNFRETFCFKNWGVHYGCKILIKSGFRQFIKLLEFIEKKYNQRKPNQNYSHTPLMKLSSITFNSFTKELFWYNGIELIKTSLKNNLNYIKPLNIAALMSLMISEKKSIKYEEFKTLVNDYCSKKEVLHVLSKFLSYVRIRRKSELEFYEKKIFSHVVETLSENFNKKDLDYIFLSFLNTYHPSIEKKFTENVLINLVERKKIDVNQVMNLWTNEFFKSLKSIKSHRDYSGLTDITGWAFCISDISSQKTFLNKIEKNIKAYKNEIQKPFKHVTILWMESFEGILIVRSLLILILLYNLENESKISPQNEEFLTTNIDFLIVLEENYQPSLYDGAIKKHSQSILKIYKTKIAC